MGDPSGKFVLLVLADHYNDSEGCAWPSINRIAHITGLNRATVQRKLKDYERGGVIGRQKRYNDTDVYTFNVSSLNSGSHDETSQSVTFGVAQCDTNSYEPLTNKKGNSKKVKLVDYKLTAADKEFAKQNGFDPDKIWQEICHWNEQHNNSKSYLNPSAFYRNWIRRTTPTKKQRGSQGQEANGTSMGKKTITKEMWDEASPAIRQYWKLHRPIQDWAHHEGV